VLPQVGLRSLRRDPLGSLARVARAQGDLGVFHLGRQRVLYLSSAELVERVFVREARHLGKWGKVRRWWVRRPPSFVVGELLETHDQKEHLRTRRAFQPAFRQERAQADVPRIAVSVDLLTDAIAGRGRPFDVYEFSGSLAVAAVCASLFDRELTLDEAERLTAKGRLLHLPGRERFSSTLYLALDILRQPRSIKRKLELNDELYAEAAGYAAVRDGARDDSLPAMLQDLGASDPAKAALSMLMTSLDPVAPAFTLMWLHTAEDKLGGRVRDEIDQAVGSGLPGHEALAALPLAQNVVLEAIRLAAPWQVSRLCHESFAIDGLETRPGDWLIASPFLLHRDPRYYERPEEFRPERWLPPESTGRPKYAFIPFGVSSWVCLGRELILTLMTAALATVARRWTIEPVVPLSEIRWRPVQSGDMAPTTAPICTIRERA
jgi:cytochrome P450